MDIFEEIAVNVEKGLSTNVTNLVTEALSKNISGPDILEKGFIKGMASLGVKFKVNDVFIQDVLVAARAMKMGLEIIRPYLAQENHEYKGKVVIGTVKADYHDIGKNIIFCMLEGAGFDVVDLGVDISKEKFLEAIQNEKADIVGMSALLTTTMGYMREVINYIRLHPDSEKVKIMIGGTPVTSDYAENINADGYAGDAQTAVEVAISLIQQIESEKKYS